MTTETGPMTRALKAEADCKSLADALLAAIQELDAALERVAELEDEDLAVMPKPLPRHIVEELEDCDLAEVIDQRDAGLRSDLGIEARLWGVPPARKGVR